MKPIEIIYQFEIESNKFQKFLLQFDPFSYELINKTPTQAEWTQLEYNQCQNCPLKKEKVPHCPVAQNLDLVASTLGNYRSFKEAKVVVVTKERTFLKKGDLQVGLQGIFGLIMATSGCPHMNFLKPMARFHLPFSSEIETIVRSTSFYLLHQYIANIDGKAPDWNLEHLHKKYEQIAHINHGMLSRIRGLTQGDADKNALIILDAFATLLTSEIKEDFSEIKKMLTFSSTYE